MTILNAFVSDDRALIGADTEGVVPGFGKTRLSKLYPLVAQQAVLAGRGNHALFASLIGPCLLAGGDFDHLATLMPELLKRGFKLLEESAVAWGIQDAAELITGWAPPASDAPIPPTIDRQEVVLIGYSARAGCMVGRKYVQESRLLGFFEESITERDPFVGPWSKRELEPIGDISSGPGMMSLARRQRELLVRADPRHAGGGDFIVAAIDRAGISTRTEGNLNAC